MENNLININYRQELVGIKTLKQKYIAEIKHLGLNDYKVFTSYDKGVLQNMVEAHVSKISEKWDEHVQKRDIKTEAFKRTIKAGRILTEIDNILLDALEKDSVDYWEFLIDKRDFELKPPDKIINDKLKPPVIPRLEVLPKSPDVLLPEQVKISVLGKLFKSQKEFEINRALENNKKEYAIWLQKCKDVESRNKPKRDLYDEEVKKYENDVKKIDKKYKKDFEAWEAKKAEFEEKQIISNSKVDLLKNRYFNNESEAIVEYCELILSKSKYPECFPKSFDFEYISQTKILIIECFLPSVDELPTLKEVKFISNKYKEYHITESQINKMYDSLMYKITLKRMFEIFNSDSIEAIEAISFNGWVNAINKATGKKENNCILSIQAKKSEFLEIDLEHVDAKTCFKKLKGVSSSVLTGLTAIQPILQINREDKRFTNHYEVANFIDSSTNLASMDWEDFEHLIREVFAQEFSSNGGEVKVTQASRDGGVDAIAFDPDPIRGGKIVIQAKRYTNTVGVSAVRDLYGTVMNEGATKGILVTTADYGPDAYEFVKGKPLTLMNGSHLLYLLEKHGHQARIDIKEARETKK